MFSWQEFEDLHCELKESRFFPTELHMTNVYVLFLSNICVA